MSSLWKAVKRCDHVHLEHYTAILMVEKEKLVPLLTLVLPSISTAEVNSALQEEFYGKPVEIADRETVEQVHH